MLEETCQTMNPTENMSAEKKERYYLRLLSEALIAIRLYSAEQDSELAHSIADAMHNLPALLLDPQRLQDDGWVHRKMHELAQRDGWEATLQRWESRCLQEAQPTPS